MCDFAVPSVLNGCARHKVAPATEQRHWLEVTERNESDPNTSRICVALRQRSQDACSLRQESEYTVKPSLHLEPFTKGQRAMM